MAEEAKDNKTNSNQVKITIPEEIPIIIDGFEVKAKHRIFKSKKVGYGAYGICRIKGFPHRISINLIEI
jgi:hypothetical protein